MSFLSILCVFYFLFTIPYYTLYVIRYTLRQPRLGIIFDLKAEAYFLAHIYISPPNKAKIVYAKKLDLRPKAKKSKLKNRPKA